MMDPTVMIPPEYGNTIQLTNTTQRYGTKDKLQALNYKLLRTMLVHRDDPESQTTPPVLQISPEFSYYTHTQQQILKLIFPELDHYLNFLRVPKRYCCLRQQELIVRIQLQCSQEVGWVISGQSVGSKYLSLFMGVDCKLLLVIVREKTKQKGLESTISF